MITVENTRRVDRLWRCPVTGWCYYRPDWCRGCDLPASHEPVTRTTVVTFTEGHAS